MVPVLFILREDDFAAVLFVFAVCVLRYTRPVKDEPLWRPVELLADTTVGARQGVFTFDCVRCGEGLARLRIGTDFGSREFPQRSMVSTGCQGVGDLV